MSRNIKNCVKLRNLCYLNCVIRGAPVFTFHNEIPCRLENSQPSIHISAHFAREDIGGFSKWKYSKRTSISSINFIFLSKDNIFRSIEALFILTMLLYSVYISLRILHKWKYVCVQIRSSWL